MSIQPYPQQQMNANVVIDAKGVDPTVPVNPFAHSIVYSSPLSDNAKYLYCMPGGVLSSVHGPAAAGTCAPLCNLLRWEKSLKPRAWVRVYENAVASNYPTTCCCGIFVLDSVAYIHLDQFADSIKAETMCTPFHCCYIVPCAGEVSATAPFACLNNCLCNCCRGWYPGLASANNFTNAVVQARQVFKQGQRMGPGSMMQTQAAPMVVQMA